MSDFLQQLQTSSLPDETKAQLAKLYDTIDDSPEFRVALSQAFQLHMNQLAAEAGVDLAEDPTIKALVQTYQNDLGALVALSEAAIQDRLETTKKQVYELQPEMDAAMAEKIRADLS